MVSVTVFFKGFIYLSERKGESTNRGGAEGETGSLLSKDPNAGLDPRTLGS